MGLFIRNPEVERKARELAILTSQTLTGAVAGALDCALDKARAQQPAHDPEAKLRRLNAVMDAYRQTSGAQKTLPPVTKADFDALWEIPGVTDRPDIP